ncbi:MAG: hypothetical protein R6U98_17210 [Pirellulaceae bacterium]
MSTATDRPTAGTDGESRGSGATSRAGSAGPFPLPLVPFERYMLADDRPGYPMTFVVQVELEGTPDREAMDAAFTDALGRHPLLTARLKRRGLKRQWVSTNDDLPRLQWRMPPAEPTICFGTPIDLAVAPAVAGEILVGEGTARLLLLFHHAACDGIGAMRFIGDLLAYYGRRAAAGGKEPTLLPVDAANLPYRGLFDVSVPEPISRWDVIRGTLREGWKVLSRRPLPIHCGRRPGKSRRSSRSRLLTITLPEEFYHRYSFQASAGGVPVNDLLLRDMFLAIQQWNAQQAPGKARGWLRVNMPTSLRGKRGGRMPAANVLGYALVTHHGDECDDPARLLTELAAETDAIRKWSLGALFIEAIRTVDRVPGLLRVASRLSRRFSTVVLSNLGDPVRRFRARLPRCGKELQAGNLTLKSISGAPPIRPGTRAALALFSYGDRLTIGLNVDPRWLDEAAAREFLDVYKQQLQRSVERAGAVEPTEIP